MANKLITVIGITGIQGGSVAETFINEPGWKVRGISRDTSKQSAKEWSDKGVEMVAADLDDVSSLKAAFKGSDVIFGTTDFWQHMQNPANHQKAQETGQAVNVVAFDAEVQQGKNIVDAAQATVDTLSMFVSSVLPDPKRWSHGKITWNYHFEAKWRVVEHLQKTYPELYKKTSFLHLAMYLSNLGTTIVPYKTPDGSYLLSFPLDGDKQVPMVDARKDTGTLAKALVKSTPGKHLMGYGSTISFNEVVQNLSQNNGVTVKYQRNTVEDLDQIMPGGFGREMGEMMEFISNPGYFGGEEAVKELNLLEPKEFGDLPLTNAKDYLKGIKL